MNRREFIAAAAALLGSAVSASAFARASKKVTVVEIAALTCPVCQKMMEASEGLSQQLAVRGVQYSFAPIAASTPEQVFGPLAYYAARAQGDRVANRVKRSLFDAYVTNGLQLTSPTQVIEWLQSDIGISTPIDYKSIYQESHSPDAQNALGRAYRLVQLSGAVDLPSFIIVAAQRVSEVISPNGRAASDQINSLLTTVSRYTKE